VRAPRWAMVRTLVMLIHAAKRSSETSSGREDAPIIVRTDESMVSVGARTAAGPSPDLRGAAERAGGELIRDGELLVFRLPTLAELRRRERASRA